VIDDLSGIGHAPDYDPMSSFCLPNESAGDGVKGGMVEGTAATIWALS
jgi:hypothetical protein